MTHLLGKARILGLIWGICSMVALSGCAEPPRPSVFSGEPTSGDPSQTTAPLGPSETSPERSGSTGLAVVQSAERYLGTPYRYGGSGSSGMDCSGLVLTVFAEHDVSLPRSCAAQARQGEQITRSELEAGDLVFFGRSDAPPSHVGIYTGGGGFIHASTGKSEVRRDRLSGGWFRDHYRGARRVLPRPKASSSENS